VDEEVRRLERLASIGDEAAITRLGRARRLSGIDTWKEKLDPTRRARERREEAENEQIESEIEFCRRAVNEGIAKHLYRGHGCWCQIFMALRRLEGLPEFASKERAGGSWGRRQAEWDELDAEFRLE
jgi:hypothetical protein